MLTCIVAYDIIVVIGSWGGGEMKEQVVNVAIDKELWKQVGIKAAVEGIDKKEVVDKALREYLKKGEIQWDS